MILRETAHGSFPTPEDGFFLPPFIKVLPGFFLFCFCFVFFNLKYRLDVRFFGLLTFHSTNAGHHSDYLGETIRIIKASKNVLIKQRFMLLYDTACLSHYYWYWRREGILYNRWSPNHFSFALKSIRYGSFTRGPFPLAPRPRSFSLLWINLGSLQFSP